MKLSLRNRFLIPSLGLIVLSMATSAVLSSINSKSALRGALTGQLQQISDSSNQAMTSWLTDRRLDIKSWSSVSVYQSALDDSFVGKAARKSATDQLGVIKKDYGYYENICLTDSTGLIVAAALPDTIGKISVGDRPYFKKSMNGELAISRVIKSKGSGKPIVVISAPVEDEGGVPGGIFLGVIDISSFSQKFIDGIRIGEAGYAYIYDGDGNVIAHPDKSQIMKLNMNDFDFGRRMIAQDRGLIEYSFNSVEKIVQFRRNERTGWSIAVTANKKELFAPVTRANLINGSVTVASVLLAGIVILFVVHSLVRPINNAVRGLNEVSVGVKSAARQIAGSSQDLAEGASEQASSLEETSASLEEMASMTRQNSSNSLEADGLMKEANSTIERANGTMDQMVVSMQSITQSSEETQKIVKTIDEIAFQTNLLALNAAVEAARAGEAGAGFAVVADEVRNLAMRAAEASKNTSNLIDESIAQIKDGAELVQKTNTAFGEVAISAKKVTELIAEIAEASKEQTQGIEQVNTAVAEMDKVTQRNAANAEESAGASEQLSTQADQMTEMVADLAELVEGRHGDEKRYARRRKSSLDDGKETPGDVLQSQPGMDRTLTFPPNS